MAGINNGANAGINVYYSGTVAAAMEGVLLGIPSVAMSVAAEEQMDYATAAGYCMQVLKELMPIKPGAVININVPLLSQGRPKGIKVVPQSNKAFDEYYVPQTDEKGQTVFQLAGEPHPLEDPQADIVALMEGYISVTALAPDMTDYKKTKHIRKRLAGLRVVVLKAELAGAVFSEEPMTNIFEQPWLLLDCIGCCFAGGGLSFAGCFLRDTGGGSGCCPWLSRRGLCNRFFCSDRHRKGQGGNRPRSSEPSKGRMWGR